MYIGALVWKMLTRADKGGRGGLANADITAIFLKIVAGPKRPAYTSLFKN